MNPTPSKPRKYLHLCLSSPFSHSLPHSPSLSPLSPLPLSLSPSLSLSLSLLPLVITLPAPISSSLYPIIPPKPPTRPLSSPLPVSPPIPSPPVQTITTQHIRTTPQSTAGIPQDYIQGCLCICVTTPYSHPPLPSCKFLCKTEQSSAGDLTSWTSSRVTLSHDVNPQSKSGPDWNVR